MDIYRYTNCFLFFVLTLISLTLSEIYNNQFAVFVPKGGQTADLLALKHGFRNLGQIGSLENYYLLEHKRLKRRSAVASDHHTLLLTDEPDIKWFEQQVELVRHKRDGAIPDRPMWDDIFDDEDLIDDRPYPRIFKRQMILHDSSSGMVFSDPMFRKQWHLNQGAHGGFDMNVVPAWKQGYSGKGVVVTILDDGIQTNHPELQENYDAEASTDINGNDQDPMPQDNGDNKHGTRCAGEVAASAHNNYCGVGIAFNASIGGVRMLDGIVNDAVEARALSLNPNHIDIYSASWGPEDDGKTVEGPGPLAKRAFLNGVIRGRHGKGSIFVWASGNGGRHFDNCNCDGYTNSIFTLSISSATQSGSRPWYLEECSSTLATTYSSGTAGRDGSIVTVDQDARLRASHICTSEHTGTSASAPIAAGVCALAIEANSELSWRDMQYLVVMTSRYEPLGSEPGWKINGAGRKFSHKFGYGLMDASQMVELASSWITLPQQHICQTVIKTPNMIIPDTHGVSVKVSVFTNGCSETSAVVKYLEHVQCKVWLRYYPRGNVMIILRSPQGTESTLLLPRPRDTSATTFDEWPFLSVHFWGENPYGSWTLEVLNMGATKPSQPGKGLLRKWQLIFYGTQINPIRTPRNIKSFTPSMRFPIPQPGFSSASFFPNFFSHG